MNIGLAGRAAGRIGVLWCAAGLLLCAGCGGGQPAASVSSGQRTVAMNTVPPGPPVAAAGSAAPGAQAGGMPTAGAYAGPGAASAVPGAAGSGSVPGNGGVMMPDNQPRLGGAPGAGQGTPPAEPSPEILSGPPIEGFEVGNIAPEIEGEDLDGEPFRLSDYRGQVVVLDFWGDW